MNYMTHTSNFAPSDYRVSPTMQSVLGFHHKQFIRAISWALNTSLVAYQNCCNQAQVSQTAQISKKDARISERISPVEIIEILSNEQQCQANSINRKTEDRPLNDKINTCLSPIAEKQSPQLTQVLSAQEKSVEFSKMKVQNKEKIMKKVHRIQKKKVEGFKVIIPKLDEIEAAYIPNQGISADKIQLRREELLSRQVFQWTDKQKNKKDKRQIRNLGN